MGRLIDQVTTAVLYTRVSTDDQAREGLSLDAQVTACRRYAADHGWVLGREFQDVMSGRRDDRPAYQSMLAEVRSLRAQGKPLAVVVAALDRFGRRVLERVRSREELKLLGVPVHSIKEGGEVSDLVANILASVAQDESERTAARVVGIVKHIREGGWSYAGVAPWGYRWRSAIVEERAAHAPKSVLEEHPDEAPYVREAFDRAARGESIRAISRWIAGLPSTATSGRTMGYAPTRRVLRSPVYIARQPVGADDVLSRPVGRWPALVDDATWTRVQERIDSHSRQPRQASLNYLLTGWVRCSACGARMTGESVHANQVTRRYRCSASILGGSGALRNCTATAHMNSLDASVLTHVGLVLESFAGNDVRAMGALRRGWAALQEPDRGDADVRRLRQLEAHAVRLRGRIKNATVLFSENKIAQSAYNDLIEDAQKSLDAIGAESERLRAKETPPALPSLEQVLRDSQGWAAELRQGSVRDQREVLTHLIERVVPVRVGYGKYEAEITWAKPLGERLHLLAKQLGRQT